MTTELQLAFMNYEDMVSRRACGDRSDAAVQKARERIESLLATNQGAAEPVAYVVRDPEGGSLRDFDDYASADQYLIQNRGRMLKPEFLFCYATPPAVMPAAPSDADALLRLAKKHGAYITGDNPGDTATFRPHELVAFAATLSQTMQPQAESAPRFSCHLQRDYGRAPCDSDCGKLRCMYPSASNAARGPELVTVGAMHKCRTDLQFDQCVNCGAIAEDLSKPRKNFITEARNALAATQPNAEPAAGDQAGAVAVIESCADICDEVAARVRGAKRLGAIDCAVALRANIPRLRAWAHQDAKEEAKSIEPAMPRSLLRKVEAPLVCYCPPGVCQAPAGFKGPCNRAAPGAAIASREQETWAEGYKAGQVDAAASRAAWQQAADADQMQYKLPTPTANPYASREEAPATPQAETLTDEQLSKAAYKGYDQYWTEDCAGKESEAWLASAKAVLALKGVQPVERGEG